MQSTYKVGDTYLYSFGEENKSKAVVKIVKILDDSKGVAQIKFDKVIVDDTGNGMFNYLLKTGKTMNASLEYLTPYTEKNTPFAFIENSLAGDIIICSDLNDEKAINTRRLTIKNKGMHFNVKIENIYEDGSFLFYCPCYHKGLPSGCVSVRVPPINRYQLLLSTNEDDEEIVYANLTDKQVETIRQDMRGEIMSEHLIMLDNGEMIDTGIIDEIQKIEDNKNVIQQYVKKHNAQKSSNTEQER